MGSWNVAPQQHPSARSNRHAETSLAAATCLRITDLGLLSILFVAPLFFGGRHPLGRLIFIGLTAATAVAWCLHQAMSREAKWVRTRANFLGFTAILLLATQILPLPATWLSWLAPRNGALLPLWSGDTAGNLQLGEWATLSLSPGSTRIALATAIAYLLLFITAAQRLQKLADIRKLLQAMAISAVGLSLFGLIQYFTSNGLFFWFYEYPYSTTLRVTKASFTCSNHFAHFVILGGGPLLAWAVLYANRITAPQQLRNSRQRGNRPFALVFAAGLSLIVLAVLWSQSRGGALGLAIVGTISVASYYRKGLVSSSFLYGTALFGLLVIGLLSLHGYDKVASQLDDFTSGSIRVLDSEAGRRKIWQANLSAIAEGGFFGAGAGSHREIYPVYLPEFLQVDYTHAENCYLQIGTENGFLGLGLLTLTLLAVGSWCWRALRHAPSQEHSILAIAVTATLVANVVHSLADFVWFIPACMSFTILLAAAALRLAQISQASHHNQQAHVIWSRSRWLSMGLASGFAASWSVTTMFGPGMAATHWDSYQLTAISSRQLTQAQLTRSRQETSPNVLNAAEDRDDDDQQALAEVSMFHLQQVLTRDPNCARAHLRMARAYLNQFKYLQRDSNNSMSLDQIRDTVFVSAFSSSRELREWLDRAFGQNYHLLYQAHHHTVSALRLCPLLGKGYLYLSQLGFLSGHRADAMEVYISQAMRCRPYDEGLLSEIGRQHWLLGQPEQAFSVWTRIYHHPGPHQLRIARFLTDLLPAEVFLETFNPDWQTIRFVWQQYQDQHRDSDCQRIVRHAIDQARRSESMTTSDEAAQHWLSLSVMQRKSLDLAGCLESLQSAYRLSPSNYSIRRQLGKQLVRAQHYEQAQPHLRWCLSRQPSDSQLRRELTEANKSRLAPVSTAYRTHLRQQ